MQGAGVHAMTCFVPPSLLPTNFLFAQPDLTMTNFFKYCPKIRIMQNKIKEIIRSLILLHFKKNLEIFESKFYPILTK